MLGQVVHQFVRNPIFHRSLEFSAFLFFIHFLVLHDLKKHT